LFEEGQQAEWALHLIEAAVTTIRHAWNFSVLIPHGSNVHSKDGIALSATSVIVL